MPSAKAAEYPEQRRFTHGMRRVRNALILQEMGAGERVGADGFLTRGGEDVGLLPFCERSLVRLQRLCPAFLVMAVSCTDSPTAAVGREVVSVSQSSVVSATDFEFRSLGTAPGHTGSVALRVSDAGLMLIRPYNAAGFGWLWSEAAGMHALVAPEGDTLDVFEMSQHGDLLARSRGAGPVTFVVRWSDGTWETLPPVPGASQTNYRTIGTNGEIALTAIAGAVQTAYLRTRDGTRLLIGSGQTVLPFEIGTSGMVTGRWRPVLEQARLFTWTREGGLTDFGSMSSNGVTGLSINSSNYVVAERVFPMEVPTRFWQPIIIRPNGMVSPLATEVLNAGAVPTGISDDSIVVGVAREVAAGSTVVLQAAVLWPGLDSLAQRLPVADPRLLSSALDISANGLTIVGVAETAVSTAAAAAWVRRAPREDFNTLLEFIRVLLDAGALTDGVARALSATIAAAQARSLAGNLDAASAILGATLAQIEGFARRGDISATDVAELARRVREVLAGIGQ